MSTETKLFLMGRYQVATTAQRARLGRVMNLVDQLYKDGHDVDTVAGMKRWLRAASREDLERWPNVSDASIDTMLALFNVHKPKDGRRDKVATDIAEQLALTPEQKITILHILAKWKI